MLKATAGWGDTMRLGRWTPLFVAVADRRRAMSICRFTERTGEIGGHLGASDRSGAAAADDVALLFPLNAQPARIEVIVSDLKTGQTLATQALQNPASFLPAGARRCGCWDRMNSWWESAERSATRSSCSRSSTAPPGGGILNPIKLPANFIGYDGVSVLVFTPMDLSELRPEQERAILRWVQCGGNLLVIPGTTPLPGKGAGGCAAVRDRSESDDRFAWRIGDVERARIVPAAGAATVSVMGQTGYGRRAGLGNIAVLPVDIAPLQFADANEANAFWRSILAGMVKVPAVNEPTEMVLSDEQDILIAGPNAADSVGRGQRESMAIRHVLESLGATGSQPRVDWHAMLLWMAGLFLLIGPVDSVILMHLRQPPRNWATIVGWIGLAVSLGAFAVARPGDARTEVGTFRLVDQVDDSAVAATDVIAVNSDAPTSVRLSLDDNEWWEPANQAARSFGPHRFLDAVCHEDKNGCRPDWIHLSGAEGSPGMAKRPRLERDCLRGI